MKRTTIQQYTSAIIGGMVESSIALQDLDHNLLKGELRELFVTDLLKRFLTSQFEVGSGIITNQKGEQSNQNDIIIYDNRILPPFIREQHLGVFPSECVLATIEVKSYLIKTELDKAETAAKKLHEEIYRPDASLYGDYHEFKPTCTIFGFYKNGPRAIAKEEAGKTWLNQNIKYLKYIGLAQKYSWIKMRDTGWTQELSDKKSHNEIKRFIAVLCDNLRTRSEIRIKLLSKKDNKSKEGHKDWIGIYIRERKD
jgi:hypothetical protein